MDVIASRVTKHPLLQDMNYEDIISMTVDVLRQVKVPASYVEKSCYKNIEEFKAEIPLEALNIRSVDYVDDIGNLVAMVKASDTRAKHISKTAAKTNNNTYHYTYFLNNNRIHCNVEEGKVFIIYDTLELDSEGLPMIPDNISLIKAIENYIKASAFRVYADLGKITRETIDYYEREYMWYMGQAQTSFQGFINEDDLEAFLADFKRIFQLEASHKYRNRYNSTRDIRYNRG